MEEINMKKRKLLAVSLAAALVLSSSMTAFAAENANVNADGTAVSSPSTRGTGYNAENVQEEGSSYGRATANSTNGTDWTVENDDDNLAEASTAASTYKTDINVWARVSDASAKIYKIDISWGSMKFEYVDGSGIWDVDTHSYSGGSSEVPHWVNSGDDMDESDDEVGCNATNNQIVVTNHSNNAIDAGFTYTMLTTSGHTLATGDAVTPFNDGGTAPSGYMDSADYKYYEGFDEDDDYDISGDNDVVGNFYGDNANAALGHTGVYGTYTGGSRNSSYKKDDAQADDGNYATVAPAFLANDSKITLPTAEAIGEGNVNTADSWATGWIYDAASIPDNLENWNSQEWKAGKRSGAVYFAFSGMPDEGQGAYLSAFKKVGTITVTIEPNTTPAYNRPTA
jgi:hypothetical protein